MNNLYVPILAIEKKIVIFKKGDGNFIWQHILKITTIFNCIIITKMYDSIMWI